MQKLTMNLFTLEVFKESCHEGIQFEDDDLQSSIECTFTTLMVGCT